MAAARAWLIFVPLCLFLLVLYVLFGDPQEEGGGC